MAAPKGNKFTQKYTEKEAENLLLDALEYAKKNGNCLSIQDAIIHIDTPHTTFYDLCRKHKVLNNIKKDINNHIVARINRNALRNKFNSTAAIWRMKQLGEQEEITQTVKNIELELSDEEIEKELKLLSEYQ